MKRTTLLLLLSLTLASQAHAFDQIIRPYQSVRTSGMGGVYETTGLYDQNFFGNPARVCANPSWRLTLFDPMVETDSSAISHVNAITSSGNTVQKIAGTSGSDNHLRLQTTMPAWYLPPSDSRRWGIAVALITSTQLDFGLENNYNIDTVSFIDVGPALTFGYQFLEDRSLAVGITGHFMYRLSSKSPYTISDLLNGTSFSPKDVGGEGTTIDADLGVTKRLSHWHPWDLDIDLGFAINDIAGGNFNGTVIHPANAPSRPVSQNRSFGGGVSVHRDTIGILHDPVLALETSDNGRNTNGSFYRTLHLGSETRLFKVLLGRIGINQGYLAAGVGLDLRILTIDFATYGEEMGLNAGEMEDRRYAIRVALQL